MSSINHLSQLNAEALIYRLNGDVLSTIFMFNARLRIDVHNPHVPSRTTRATSQVSHKWRRLALSLPSLWAASLDTDDPIAWIEVVLARAKEAPITVVILI